MFFQCTISRAYSIEVQLYGYQRYFFKNSKNRRFGRFLRGDIIQTQLVGCYVIYCGLRQRQTKASAWCRALAGYGPWQSSNFRVTNYAQITPGSPNCQPGAKCVRVLRHGHSGSGSPKLIFASRANPPTLLMR